ncbi:unnamed protein product, partial [Musa acuminata var. zebrina]
AVVLLRTLLLVSSRLYLWPTPSALIRPPLRSTISSARERHRRGSPSFASRAASLSFHDEVVGVETLDLIRRKD